MVWPENCHEIFRSNCFHLNKFFIVFFVFFGYMLMCLTFSGFDLVRRLMKEEMWALMYFSGHFRVKLFPPEVIFFKLFFKCSLDIFEFELKSIGWWKGYGPLCAFRNVSWQFSGQIVSTCADVFNIFKFELNPLDGRGDVGLCVLFGSIFRTLV